MSYSIDKRLNSFMKKIILKLENLRSWDGEHVDHYDGHSYDGFMSKTVGVVTLTDVIPFYHVINTEFGFTNEELDLELEKIRNDSLNDFKEENPSLKENSEEFYEEFDNYVSDLSYTKFLQIQIRDIGFCTWEEKQKYKRHKYLIYVQGFLKLNYSQLDENMREDIVIPVYLNNLKKTFNEVSEAIDIMYEDYEKISVF